MVLWCARCLSAGGRFALSAEDEGGLAIFSLGAPSVQDSDQDGIPDDWERQIVDADPNDSIQNITQVLPGDDSRSGRTTRQNAGHLHTTATGCSGGALSLEWGPRAEAE